VPVRKLGFEVMAARLGAAAVLLAAIAGGALPATAAAACSSRTPPDPRVPIWQRAIGFPLGSRAATDRQIDRYMTAVAQASGRVRLVTAGASAQGRPIRYAIAGEPANVAPARLNGLAERMRAARDGRLSAQAVRTLAAGSPLFAWIGGSVHGNEPSGGDADMRLLYRLAAGRTCADLARIRRLVTFVLPLQNPDGRALGTHVDAARFDLNRDWFAQTQPETRAKLAALERYPPVVFADQHEDAGSGFFFPPNADPIHHEVSPQALAAIDGVIAPRLRAAFAARHVAYVNYQTYDLFFMGYGDTVPSTLFGAAGMTFEKGAQAAYPAKVADHFLAADTTLTAAADHRRRLLLAWGQQWGQAIVQGAAGELQPNHVVQPGDHVRFEVPSTRVYGYAIRTDLHGADAEALVHRLIGVGVHVQRLTQPAAVPALHPYGGAPTAATLPAGTFIVSMRQAAKHWVQAMLGSDPYVALPYFYDVSSWSNPLLMGLDGGALEAPLNLPAGELTAVAASDHPTEPAAGAGGYTFAGGSEAAAELAFALLRDGVAVSRTGDGGFMTASSATVTAAAAARRVALRPLDAVPAGAAALRRPAVAVLGDTGGDDAPGDLSAGWARWLLGARDGLATTEITESDVLAGRLDRYQALVVPDGTTSASQLSVGALAGIQAWVRAGGTLIGWRGRGLAVAQAAGVTAVREAPTPAGLQVPGAELRVAFDDSDPVALGEEPEGYAFNTGDPVLAANGARVVAAYPTGARFFVSGYTTGTGALQGTAAATDEVVGAGRVVLFAFDPAFRGYTDGTERLVANALLAPAPPAAGRGAARAARPLDPAALAGALAPARDATVQVASADEGGLLRAAHAAGVPRGFTLDRDLTTVTLRVPNPRGLAAEDRPWTLRLPSALAAQGVRPLLAVF
jgi:hypothetical protein